MAKVAKGVIFVPELVETSLKRRKGVLGVKIDHVALLDYIETI